MEILIVGGILVALMVLVSTKIKKNAARAFDSEVIETTDFRLVKPTGFLHPLRDESAFAFEAYSKEFGEKSERNIWKGEIYLTVSEGLNFDSDCKNIKKDDGKIITEKILNDTKDGEKICLFERKISKDDATSFEFRKIVESRRQRKTYDLKMLILSSFRNEFIGRVDELMSNFQLK